MNTINKTPEQIVETVIKGFTNPKISNVIRRLEKLKAKHGDLAVYSKVHDGELIPVNLGDTFVETVGQRLILNDCRVELSY